MDDAATIDRTGRLPAPGLAHRSAGRALDGGRVALAAVVAFWLTLVVFELPFELIQDSWLTLVGGREVAQHGLPQHDMLTAWTLGARWVDQQWLGQLFYFRLSELGGIRLVLLAHAGVAVATFAVGVRAAQRRGAPVAAIVLAGLAALTVAPWALQMRTQDLGELFFVCLLALLAADARRPSRRVYLALPLLALWANVHGSVVLGAALLGLRGLAMLLPAPMPLHARVRRAAVLVAAAVAAPLASPYGFALVGYYRSLLANPVLHWFIDEWRPSGPGLATLPFYALAAATIWLLGRYGRHVTRFEQAALLVTLVAAVDAKRSIVWFGLAALVLLPGLLAPAFTRLDFARFARFTRPLALAVAATVAAVSVFAVTRPAHWYVREWPAAAQAHVASLAPGDIVFADDRYADWLLWEHPQLRGRVAYDVRFELFGAAQFRRLFAYRNRVGDHWRDVPGRAKLVVFDPALQGAVERGLLDGTAFRPVVRTKRLVVLER